METTIQKTWKPIVGGILSIVSGVSFSVVLLLILTANWGEAPPEAVAMVSAYVFVSGIMPIVGSIFALRRKRWGLAFAGSICATIGMVFTGVPALVFIVLSRNEF